MRLSGVEKRLGRALLLPAVLTVLLFLFRVSYTHSWTYWFLMENLVLAFLPLALSLALVKNLKKKQWNDLSNIILGILWLIFLPNAWYVLTDYVHVAPTGQINLLFDIVLITSLTTAGFAAGFTSLMMVHKQLLKKLSFELSALAVAAILLLSSFAIYLGRDLRWSSWDVVANPDGIALDVSDRFLHPLGHPRSWDMTGAVFLLLITIYASLWIWLEPKTGRQ